MRRWLWVPVILVSAAPAPAAPIGIEILSEQYTTTLWARTTVWPDFPGAVPSTTETTETASADTPLNELLEFAPKHYGHGIADTWSVATDAWALPFDITFVASEHANSAR